MHMTRHEDRFVVRSRVTREFPGKICERLQRHMRASVKFKLSCTVYLNTIKTIGLAKMCIGINYIKVEIPYTVMHKFQIPPRILTKVT